MKGLIMAGIVKSLGICLLSMALISCNGTQVRKWAKHDPARTHPPVVTPGQTDRQPPSDAVVLFDGTDLGAWQNTRDGGEAKWKIIDDYMEVVPKSGDIATRQPFGSCQLHIEWSTPEVVNGASQGRGNSGVFLMSKYEVQILDSYENVTYADGQAGAVYGQNPPMVNASRKPGRWQSYDIIFHAPKFKDGKAEKPATITVLHNGVLIQDNWVIRGTTYHKNASTYEPHPDKMPLVLQDHHNPTRFRNIWIRPLD